MRVVKGRVNPRKEPIINLSLPAVIRDRSNRSSMSCACNGAQRSILASARATSFASNWLRRSDPSEDRKQGRAEVVHDHCQDLLCGLDDGFGSFSRGLHGISWLGRWICVHEIQLAVYSH